MSRVLATTLLAQKSGEAAKAGPIGLAVILLLCIVCYFLFKSMSRHMRNVRDNFPDQPPVQRVKAPLVHPSAVTETSGPMLESRTGRMRSADAPTTAVADPDVLPTEQAPEA